MKTLGITLEGGLGNQLSMWASAFSLAKKTQSQLLIRFRDENSAILEIVSNDLLPLNPDLPNLLESLEVRFAYLSRRFNRPGRLNLLDFLKSDSVYIESPYSEFDQEVQKNSALKVLIGYFHSWRYFEEDREIIRNSMRIDELRSLFFDKFPKLLEGDY